MRSLAARITALPDIVLLAGLVVVSTAFHTLAVRGVQAPQILCDEFIHAGIADSLVRDGHFAYRGEPLRYSFTYPVALAPAWSVGTMQTTFALTKATNALLLSSAAVPVFFWARTLVSRGWAFVAAVLVVLMPAFAFAGLVMTENIAFPTFVLALFAVAAALERPTSTRQLLAGGAVVLAVISRYQSLVLLPVFVLAALLKLGLDWRAGVARAELGRRVRQLAVSVGVTVGVALAYAVWKAASGESLASSLGPYAGLETAVYPFREVLRWTMLNTGEFVLAGGFVGASALVLLAWEGVAGRLRTDAQRAFAAVGVAAVAGVLLEVGVFAAGIAGYIVERYSFYALPVLLLALVVWLGQGLPRPSLGIAVAIALPLVFVLSVLSLERDPLREGSLPVNTLTLYAFQRLTERLGGDVATVQTLTALGIAAAAIAFAVVPRRIAAVALPVALGATMLAFFKPVVGATAGSSLPPRGAAGLEPDWVDAAVGSGKRVLFLLTPNADVQTTSLVLLETEYWNRSVDRVLSLGATQLCPLPSIPIQADAATGQIVRTDRTPPEPINADYVVAPRTANIAGSVVAEGGASLLLPLALYRAEKPLRLASSVDGVEADGWMHADAAYTQLTGEAGTIDVAVSRAGWPGEDVPGNVTISVARLVRQSDGTVAAVPTGRGAHWVIHSLRSRTFHLKTPHPPFRVTVHVDPTFSPSQFGAPDTRQLGAQVAFSYVPRS